MGEQGKSHRSPLTPPPKKVFLFCYLVAFLLLVFHVGAFMQNWNARPKILLNL